MSLAKVSNIALTVILVLVVVALAAVVAAVGFSSLLVSTGPIVIFAVMVAVVSVVAVMITVPMAAVAYDKEQEFNAHYGL